MSAKSFEILNNLDSSNDMVCRKALNSIFFLLFSSPSCRGNTKGIPLGEGNPGVPLIPGFPQSTPSKIRPTKNTKHWHSPNNTLLGEQESLPSTQLLGSPARSE